jgi:hypothetical protein
MSRRVTCQAIFIVQPSQNRCRYHPSVFRDTMTGGYEPVPFRQEIGNPGSAAIYAVVGSTDCRHWVILGSDAHRRIGLKLDMLRAEYEAGKDMAQSTNYPNASAPPIL